MCLQKLLNSLAGWLGCAMAILLLIVCALVASDAKACPCATGDNFEFYSAPIERSHCPAEEIQQQTDCHQAQRQNVQAYPLDCVLVPQRVVLVKQHHHAQRQRATPVRDFLENRQHARQQRQQQRQLQRQQARQHHHHH